MIILVRRAGALGDVVLTTPVIRALALVHPDAKILVQTGYPEVFENSPYAKVTGEANPAHDLLIDLNLAYEKHPKRHVVHSYFAEAFTGNWTSHTNALRDAGMDWQQEMFDPAPWAYLRPFEKPFVVVHGTGGIAWRNRIQRPAFWRAVHDLLHAEGYPTISVGRTGDDGQGSIDCRNMFTLAGLRRLVGQAVCFVGSDSGPMHIAGATATPIVGLFTCTRPEYRLPWRRGELGHGCIGLVPEQLDCVGCLHNEKPPVTSVGCRRGDWACVESDLAIVPEAVLASVQKLIAVRGDVT